MYQNIEHMAQVMIKRYRGTHTKAEATFAYTWNCKISCSLQCLTGVSRFSYATGKRVYNGAAFCIACHVSCGTTSSTIGSRQKQNNKQPCTTGHTNTHKA